VKIALLFPGQGAQYAGMGKDFAGSGTATEIYDCARTVLGYDLKQTVFEGTDETLRQTHVTQPAVFTASVVCYETFKSKLAPDLLLLVSHVAGHSLGEYSALYAAGVVDYNTGIKLVKTRAELIQKAAEKNVGTMAAIIGLAQGQVQKICADVTASGNVVEPVNYNSTEQTVVSGSIPGVEKVVAIAKELSAGSRLFKTVMLNVSGAFHSSLMNDAADNMSTELKQYRFNNAAVPVVTNCDAVETVLADEFKHKLGLQINHAVLWLQTINRMSESGVDTFIELGPGKVLSGLVKRINKTAKTFNIEDNAGLEKVLAELKGA
jgi:[acyl-carrier-protein] S-malonyltransferase